MRSVLLLGVAASVAANILHAQEHIVARGIAAWPPLALLFTIEVIARVPVHRRSHAIIRIAATTGIGMIAAWVSYWHMVAVASRYGETGSGAYLLPLSVDGLVVASISLVELAGRIRAAKPTPTIGPPPRPAPPARVLPPAPSMIEGVNPPDPPVIAVAQKGRPSTDTEPDGEYPPPPPRRAAQPVHNEKRTDPTPADVPAGTREAVLFWHAHDPNLDADGIAAKIGKSPRTVYRYLPETQENQRQDTHVGIR